MFITNFCKYSLLRIFLNCITKRKIYNKDYLYTYYTSLLFQLVILPILNILYYFNKVSYNYIIISSINYFLTDFPEIFYSKLYKYFTHHIISINILLGCFIIPDNLKKNALINSVLLELGSSVMSLDVLVKCNYYKPFIFGSSRLLSIVNGFYIVYNVKNKFLKFMLLCLIILLTNNNYKIFKSLIYKMNK